MRLTVVLGNYFKKYMQWEINKATGITVRKPFQQPRELRSKIWLYNEYEFWSDEAKRDNRGRTRKHIWVEPIAEEDRKVFVGDRVEILTGKDKGKIGLVSKLIPERNWCLVKGLNCEYRYTTQMGTENSPGSLSTEEKPLLVTTEVSLIDPSDNKATDIEWKYDEKGQRVRVSLYSGRIIPMPNEHVEMYYDNTNCKTYKETSKDTLAKLTQEVTYEPKLSTFEQDIMDAMGIVETRVRQKKYWY